MGRTAKTGGSNGRGLEITSGKDAGVAHSQPKTDNKKTNKVKK
jgi:hypothetical protein